MKNLISVKRERFTLDNGPDGLDYLHGSVFIPCYGVNYRHYYYLINPADSSITAWTIDLSDYIADLLINQKLPQKAVYPWNHYKGDSFLENSFFAHSAELHNNRIFVSFIAGNFILILNIDNDGYGIIRQPDRECMVYSSTNMIIGDELYFARWNVHDSVKRAETRYRETIPLEFGKYHIGNEIFTILGTIDGTDDIHAVAVNREGLFLSLEMCQEPVIKYPEDIENAPHDQMIEILKNGLFQSHFTVYDPVGDSSSALLLDSSPAHIEFDLSDPEVVYILQHNNSMIRGGVLSFGNVGINKIRVCGGRSEIISRYEGKNLFRSPSVKPFMYSGKQYLVCPGYPNNIEIINSADMTLYKKIALSKQTVYPDYSAGPFKYPHSGYDKTPYTIHPINNTPYLVLTSVWNMTVYDFNKEEKMGTVHFNVNQGDFIACGHSSYFPD